jgi:hypothetical protein
MRLAFLARCPTWFPALPIATITFALLGDSFRFAATVGCERAAEIDLLAGELSLFATDEALVAFVRPNTGSGHRNLTNSWLNVRLVRSLTHGRGP